MTSRANKSKLGQLNWWKVFYFITFLTGIALMVFEIHIYRVTIIRVIIPISIILSVGLIAFIINKNHYKSTYEVKGSFFALMQNMVSWGFIACYSFMATNYYLADNELKDSSFQIESRSSMPGPKGRRDERKPLVTIDYFGFKKELVFHFRDTERVENADNVSVIIRKGLLGFDILDHYDVVDDRMR